MMVEIESKLIELSPKPRNRNDGKRDHIVFDIFLAEVDFGAPSSSLV